MGWRLDGMVDCFDLNLGSRPFSAERETYNDTNILNLLS